MKDSLLPSTRTVLAELVGTEKTAAACFDLHEDYCIPVTSSGICKLNGIHADPVKEATNQQRPTNKRCEALCVAIKCSYCKGFIIELLF